MFSLNYFCSYQEVVCQNNMNTALGLKSTEGSDRRYLMTVSENGPTTLEKSSISAVGSNRHRTLTLTESLIQQTTKTSGSGCCKLLLFRLMAFDVRLAEALGALLSSRLESPPRC